MILAFILTLILTWTWWYLDLKRLTTAIWLRQCFIEELKEECYWFAVREPWLTREGDGY